MTAEVVSIIPRHDKAQRKERAGGLSPPVALIRAASHCPRRPPESPLIWPKLGHVHSWTNQLQRDEDSLDGSGSTLDVGVGHATQVRQAPTISGSRQETMAAHKNRVV